jgi:hypothetical protein
MTRPFPEYFHIKERFANRLAAAPTTSSAEATATPPRNRRGAAVPALLETEGELCGRFTRNRVNRKS